MSPETKTVAPKSKAAFRQWNESMVRKYDPDLFHRHPNPLVRWIERRRVQAILQLLAVRPTDRVLEVGCGAGNILERVRARVRCGIDLSSFILEKAKGRLGAGGYLQLADAESLPYRSSSMDRVYCSEVLEHVQEPTKVVAEMARILQTDGVAVISVPNEPVITALKRWLRRFGLFSLTLQSRDGYRSPEAMEDEWHLHSFDLQLLRDMLAGVMLVVAEKAVPWRWLPLRYVVCCQPIQSSNGPHASSGGLQ